MTYQDGFRAGLEKAAEAIETFGAQFTGETVARRIAGHVRSIPIPEGAEGWRPIDSAPKDRWIMAHGDGDAIQDCPFICQWYGKRDGWIEVYSDTPVRPTHWRPLDPPPPSKEG
jgi:hypothetical protein